MTLPFGSQPEVALMSYVNIYYFVSFTLTTTISWRGLDDDVGVKYKVLFVQVSVTFEVFIFYIICLYFI
jgi:hypothetical protein